MTHGAAYGPQWLLECVQQMACEEHFMSYTNKYWPTTVKHLDISVFGSLRWTLAECK